MRTRFLRFLLAASFTAGVCAAQQPRTAILLELFTSEGCSSCPPADALLTKIDQEQPIKNADLIVLSEHVDYWNHGGWTDPYSSAAFSSRQQRYATLLHADDIYTPQLVVDGSSQLVGSDWPKIHAVLERSDPAARKLAIELKSSDAGQGKKLNILIRPQAEVPSGDVYVALAADHAETAVQAGENAGHHLAHTAVASSIKRIGSISAGASFSGEFNVPSQKVRVPTRVIVFIQNPHTGRVLGVSQLKM
jgi:hypothetical protein